MATSKERQFEYDVFLSYNRCERDGGIFFPQHVHGVLTQKGIKSYKYSEDLEQGEETAPRVVVVFYGVLPSCVRRQTESYQAAMERHVDRYGSRSDKVRQWREALTEVGNMRGRILAGNGGEAERVQEVVQDIETMLHQLKAPTAREASPKPPSWAVVIGILTSCAPLIFGPTILLLASGHADDIPVGIVIFIVYFSAFMYLVFAATIIFGKMRQNSA
ncbi:hypothetical protein NL676_005121 [Syzygium grande]|nr:hypothetical protein NL676_005121 [Syzygium grande]